MSIYRVNLIRGSGGFKVHVADKSGGLRVVGIFLTEADANDWIVADSHMAERSVAEALYFCGENKKSPAA
jgi:hypothetical protein